MASYTRYLTTVVKAVDDVAVRLIDSTPLTIAQNAIKDSCEARYSPIMPAFLIPQEGPPPIPSNVESILFLFANAPYKALGTLKVHLQPNEISKVYFTEGLASVILLNATIDRAKQIRSITGDCPFEYWPVKDNKLNLRSTVVEMPASRQVEGEDVIQLPSSDNPELKVYVEQIAASLASLWFSYGIYFPEERATLQQVAITANNLLQQYSSVQNNAGKNSDLVCQKKANAIISALVEISAAISYAVTQGTTGSLPILSNRSPFPHHSLLGIGGAIRALTKYTRYLEAAFMVRSASKVINSQYSVIKHNVPVSIAKHNSGAEYKFPDSQKTTDEHFDCGGDFRQDNQAPLITHFSLRHGFMESKFSVTAASEALTAETLPQWTLMTLSHEVMHSRVRAIFQALFGKTWDEHEDGKIICKKQYDHFVAWIGNRENSQQVEVGSGIRNAILNFCYAIEKYYNPVAETEDRPGNNTFSIDKLNEYYSRHKQLAIEIIVHFHDYYFIYACQPKMYIMSLWASWIKVAAPYARPLEYLTRSLVTIACGTGLEPRAAFEFARDTLFEGLDALESAGVSSPLFDELRRLLSEHEEDVARAYFYPGYYLIDIVRLFFASRKIAEKIDRIENDPFAEGSTFADDYTASIYVFGEGESISPIRYSLATLFKTLSNQSPVDDPQWLTAWNYMVISSQETKI